MRRIFADRLISIGGGVALLLLLAVQEKICPQLLVLPAASPASPGVTDARLPATPDGEQGTPSDPKASPESEPIPLTLTSVLPDAMPARWPGLPSRASLRDSAGWCSGVCASQPLSPPQGVTGPLADLVVTPPWRWALLLPAPEGVPPCGDAPPVRDPALHTVLMRTGPPRG